MAQLLESFTGAAGATLQSRNSDSGHTWTKIAWGTGGQIDRDLTIDSYARGSHRGLNGNSVYLSSFIPATGNFDIDCDIRIGGGNAVGVLHGWDGLGTDGNAGCSVDAGLIYNAVTGNYETGADYNHPMWGVVEKTFLLSPPTIQWPNGTRLRVYCQMRGNNFTVWINGKRMGSGNRAFGNSGTRVGLIVRDGDAAINRVLIRDASVVLAAGFLTQGWSKPENICIYYGGSEGGTAPYVTTLHASTDPDFVPGVGNQIGVFDATQLIEWSGALEGVVYYFKAKTTDNVAATATSSASTNAFNPYIVAVRPERVLRLYGIGDSLMGLTGASGDETAYWRRPMEPEFANGSWDVFVNGVRALSTAKELAISYAQTFAVGGTKTADWIPGSGNLATLNTAAALYDGDVRYSPPGSEAWTIIQLGANDAFPTANVSVATFMANMQAIVNDQLGRNRKVFIIPTSFCAPDLSATVGWWNGASDVRLQEYAAALVALHNGNTVFVADAAVLRRKFAARAADWLSGDGYNLHYNNTGQQVWGAMVAEEFVQVAIKASLNQDTQNSLASIEDKVDRLITTADVLDTMVQPVPASDPETFQFTQEAGILMMSTLNRNMQIRTSETIIQ